MTAYCYVKAQPQRIHLPGSRHKKVLPVVFWVSGVILLANVFYPLLSYLNSSREKFSPALLRPVGEPVAEVLSQEPASDYRRPQSWFPAAPQLPPQPSKITHYTISIPELGIEDAAVEIGGEDLLKSMIHYSGTALPGQYGNATIFCHSALPQFFNAKNYKTICSTLPKLDIGDDIMVNYDGITYRYQVYKMVEVKPEDVEVLAQYYDGQYLSMITCVPPGTYLRRLIVRARLR